LLQSLPHNGELIGFRIDNRQSIDRASVADTCQTHPMPGNLRLVVLRWFVGWAFPTHPPLRRRAEPAEFAGTLLARALPLLS